MSQLLETFHQGMVTCDRLDTRIWIDEVGAAIADMGDRDLLSHHQGGCKRCSAAGRFLLDGALCFPYRCLHNLLEGFFHGIWLNVKKVGMKLADDISRHAADGGIARYFAELMPAHAIGNNI